MKGSGCAVLGCAGLLVLALALLTGIVNRSLPPAPEVPRGEAELRRVDEGDRLRLSYGFSDSEGRPRRFVCEISKRDYDRDRTSFGYVQEELDRTVGSRLRELFERQAAARGLRPYVHFEVYGGTSYRWRWTVAGRPASALAARLRDFDRWLDRDLAKERQALTARFLRERGVLLHGTEAEVDYAREVEGATGPLTPCFEALREAGTGEDDRRLLALFLVFFQELRYEVPPEVESGRHILGFRVPTAVLALGGGDCDSKSAAFCALWRHRPERAILILVPDHALVGVEGIPRPDEAYVRIGNRYFVLCEVAGPGKIPPGGSRISGSFEYVMIEPAGG